MTVSVIIGGDDWFDFSTTKGMKDFRDWVDQLVVDRFPVLSHLVDWGWVNDLDKLESEITIAVGINPPISSLRKTIEGFLVNLINRKSAAESLMLTNGLSTDDNEGEWWIDGKPV